MRVGLGHMGIRPRDFWDYTLSEWLFAMEGYVAANGGDTTPPMDRQELESLMEKYPDVNRNTT